LYNTQINSPQHSFPTRRSSDLAIKLGHEHILDDLLSKIYDLMLTTGIYPRFGFNKGLITLFVDAINSDEAKISYLTDTHEKLSRSEEHTSELQSRFDLVCRLLL